MKQIKLTPEQVEEREEAINWYRGISTDGWSEQQKLLKKLAKQLKRKQMKRTRTEPRFKIKPGKPMPYNATMTTKRILLNGVTYQITRFDDGNTLCGYRAFRENEDGTNLSLVITKDLARILGDVLSLELPKSKKPNTRQMMSVGWDNI